MTYDELQKKYIQVCNENMRLRAENQDLRKQLGILDSPKEFDVPDSAVNKHSSVDEKIDLYMSLFIGRDDVYAKRWYSVQSGKSGYQPVCGNEWSELCNKQKYKCNNCPNRKLLPLNSKAIFDHLSGKDKYGRDVVGIYPMSKDETCHFLSPVYANKCSYEYINSTTEHSSVP